MKTIKKDELYANLSGFLRDKGIVLEDGPYTQRLQKSCALLTDAINTAHTGLTEVRAQVDRKLDQMRQVIHEKTAPKPEAERAATAVPAESDTSSSPDVTSSSASEAVPQPPRAKRAVRRPKASRPTPNQTAPKRRRPRKA